MSAKALGFELQKPTVVTVGMQVTGNLVSQADIRIEGRVEGDVRGRRVAVSVGGSVAGSVFAEAVLVEGAVRGQINAPRVRLMPSAEVAMDVIYHEIIVDSGAQLNGSMFPRPASEWEKATPAGKITPPKVPELKSGPPAETPPDATLPEVAAPVSDIPADKAAPPPEDTVAIPLGSGGKIYTAKENSTLPEFMPVPREPEVARPARRGFGLATLFVAVVVVGAAGTILGLNGFGDGEDKVSATRIAAEVEAAAKTRANEEDARRKAEEDAQRAAQAEAQRKAEEVARKTAETQRKAAEAAEAARKAAVAQAQRRAAEKAKKAAIAQREIEEKARQEAERQEAERQEAGRKAQKAAADAAAAEARRQEEELSHKSALADLKRRLEAEPSPQDDENAGALADANTRRDSGPEPVQQEPVQQAPVRRPATQQAAVQTAPATSGQAIDEFKAGVEAFRRKDFDEAIARLSPAIESGKLSKVELATAYRRRAESFAGKKQYKRAIADYTETIRLTPGDPVAYNNRGYAFNRLGQGTKALADSSRAIEINPGYAHAYSNRCWAYQKLRQRDKAIADCRRALSLNPGLSFARKSLRRMGIEP